MITRKLSKAQGFVVQGLASGLAQLQAQANEAQAALNEQAELLRFKYGLPEGESRFTQDADGWAIVVKPKREPEPKTSEVPVPETDEDGDAGDAGKAVPEETKAADDA